MNDPRDPNVTVDSPLVSAASITTDHAGDAVSTAGSGRGAGAATDDLPTIPGYRVLYELARGGMGRVLAARDLTLDRDVAIKVLMPGAAADRFIRESKITARLPHPGIPPVHALGTLADSSPFLAMKLIAGRTLAAELTTADRPRLLQAFTQVCQAVGFAHSRGVIHRDLKPSNVMVGAYGEVQVMDWGLSKELASREPESEIPAVAFASGSDENTDQTQAGTIMGTPGYMAPEQARGEATDARTDVFALGGILCRILTGHPPVGGKTSLEQVQRTRAADLSDAHARLDTCGAHAELVALCRRCLSAIPAERPSDGQAVADGVTAYLDGAQARLRAAEISGAEANERAKAERRARRVQMIAASLLLMVLVGGIAGTTIGLYRAHSAKEKAEFAEGETKLRAEELQQVADYQAKMLQRLDPADTGVKLKADLRARHTAALAKDKKVSEAERLARTAAFERELHAVNATDAAVALLDRTVLAPAVLTIEAQFANQPLVDASLRHTLGVAYRQLGRSEEALALHRRAHELRAAAQGEEHPDTLSALSELVEALIELQRLDEAESSLTRLLESCRNTLGPDHPDTLTALARRATLLDKQGKQAEWEDCARDVLERRSRVLGNDHIDTVRSVKNLCLCLLHRDKFAEAERLLRKVVEDARRIPDQGQQVLASSLDMLSRALQKQGKLAEAEPYLREALEKSRQQFGEDHPDTLMTIHNLAALLQSLGQLGESEPFARESLDKSRRVRGNEHRETLVTLNVLGRVYALQGKFAEAEPYWREALATGRRVLGEDHPDTAAWIHNLGSLLSAQDKLTEAEPLIREAIAKFSKAHGNDHSSTVTALGQLGALQRDLGKLAEAEICFREAFERSRRTLGEENPGTLSAIIRLGGLLALWGNSAEAVALLAPAEAKARTAFLGANMRFVATLLENLGKARIALAKSTEDFTAAEANLLEAHTIFVKIRGPNSKEARGCVSSLSDAYATWDKAEPGKGYDAKAAEWKAKLPKPAVPPPTEQK